MQSVASAHGASAKWCVATMAPFTWVSAVANGGKAHHFNHGNWCLRCLTSWIFWVLFELNRKSILVNLKETVGLQRVLSYPSDLFQILKFLPSDRNSHQGTALAITPEVWSGARSISDTVHGDEYSSKSASHEKTDKGSKGGKMWSFQRQQRCSGLKSTPTRSPIRSPSGKRNVWALFLCILLLCWRPSLRITALSLSLS